MIVNKGFKRKREASPVRIPPGQYITQDYPVLSLGPTPQIDKDEWKLTTSGLGKVLEWNWEEFQKLPQTSWTVDIHCVTKWSKLSTKWKGVLLDEIIKLVKLPPEASHMIAFSYDGYSTNLPLKEVTDGKALIAFEYEHGDISPEHGGPVRFVIPHLYFWKSAKWLNEIRFTDRDMPGFWETRGYHNHGDPWKEERYSDF